jgi:hypothetical protein
MEAPLIIGLSVQVNLARTRERTGRGACRATNSGAREGAASEKRAAEGAGTSANTGAG